MESPNLALVISCLRTWSFIESNEGSIPDQWAGTESFPKIIAQSQGVAPQRT